MYEFSSELCILSHFFKKSICWCNTILKSQKNNPFTIIQLYNFMCKDLSASQWVIKYPVPDPNLQIEQKILVTFRPG